MHVERTGAVYSVAPRGGQCLPLAALRMQFRIDYEATVEELSDMRGGTLQRSVWAIRRLPYPNGIRGRTANGWNPHV
jgi:hypothetical protein